MCRHAPESNIDDAPCDEGDKHCRCLKLLVVHVQGGTIVVIQGGEPTVGANVSLNNASAEYFM